MEDLRRLWVEDGRQQMEVPLKRAKAHHYVFCKVTSVRGQIQVHRDQPIPQSTLSRQLKVLARSPALSGRCSRIGSGTVGGRFLMKAVRGGIFRLVPPSVLRY